MNTQYANNQGKYVFFELSNKKHHPMYSSENRRASKIKFEDTWKSRLWRIYGKLIWSPLQRLLRRSCNSYPHYDSIFKAMLPERVDYRDYILRSFVFMNRAYRTSNPLHILLSIPLYNIRKVYLSNAYLVCNWDYTIVKTWKNPIKYKIYLRPLLYVGRVLEYIYRADYECCGYDEYFEDVDDECSRYEVHNSGVSGTPDGTDYWSYGYMHCPRCNTPIKYSENSL